MLLLDQPDQGPELCCEVGMQRLFEIRVNTHEGGVKNLYHGTGRLKYPAGTGGYLDAVDQ